MTKPSDELIAELQTIIKAQAKRIAELERGRLDAQVEMYEGWQLRIEEQEED